MFHVVLRCRCGGSVLWMVYEMTMIEFRMPIMTPVVDGMVVDVVLELLVHVYHMQDLGICDAR